MSNAEQAAYLDFIGIGGRFSATDAFYQRPEYRNVIGGYFDQHPWHQTVVVNVAELDHPLVVNVSLKVVLTTAWSPGSLFPCCC